MASLIKRKGSPFWFIQYRQGDKWNKRSTGLRHSVSAETRKAREECAKQTLKELTVSRVGGESRWDAWVLKFLEGRYADRQKTLARYKTTWRTWMLYLDKLGVELPMQVTHVHCSGFSADGGIRKRVGRGRTLWTKGRAKACSLAFTRCRIGPHCMTMIG